jgi:hypothetical protein
MLASQGAGDGARADSVRRSPEPIAGQRFPVGIGVHLWVS